MRSVFDAPNTLAVYTVGANKNNGTGVGTVMTQGGGSRVTTPGRFGNTITSENSDIQLNIAFKRNTESRGITHILVQSGFDSSLGASPSSTALRNAANNENNFIHELMIPVTPMATSGITDNFAQNTRQRTGIPATLKTKINFSNTSTPAYYDIMVLVNNTTNAHTLIRLVNPDAGIKAQVDGRFIAFRVIRGFGG